MLSDLTPEQLQAFDEILRETTDTESLG
jgi:hypothetical protein